MGGHDVRWYQFSHVRVSGMVRERKDVDLLEVPAIILGEFGCHSSVFFVGL